MRVLLVTLLTLVTICLPCQAKPSSVSVPTSTYGPEKTAVMATVGGGQPVLTEVDTGSGVLVVEKSWAGPQVRMTSQRLTITYGSGRVPREGTIGYARFSLLAEGRAVITTTVDVPVLVVADGVVGRGGANHAIFGLRMSSNVSPKLFFPPPLNGMVIIDRPHQTMTFGTFTAAERADFGIIKLGASRPMNHQVQPSSPAGLTTWNDSAIPMRVTIAGGPPAALWNALFDSGALSNIHARTIPPYFNLRKRILTNSVSASVNTSRGPMPIPFTHRVFATRTAQADMINAGNNLFNHYRVLFDQVHGSVGLARTTKP